MDKVRILSIQVPTSHGGDMDPLTPKIESFLILITVSDQSLANKLCAALEHANVPVMVEHVELNDGGRPEVGYRLLAPSQFRESAMRIIDLNMSLHETRNMVTTRADSLAAVRSYEPQE